MSEEIRQFDHADIEANKTFSILIVIFYFLFFLPLVMEDKKDSAYLKYYANQALIAFLFGLIPGLGPICAIILLVGIVSGSYMPIPLVGDKLEIIK